jgi:hypothetical protein
MGITSSVQHWPVIFLDYFKGEIRFVFSAHFSESDEISFSVTVNLEKIL